METPVVDRKALLSAFLVSAVVLAVSFVCACSGNATKIVFCNVGQGDGAYIRAGNRTDLIIDAGPDNGAMLRCLGRHMPFWDRTIEYVVVSHPQSDHIGGLREIARRYRIGTIISLPLPPGFPVAVRPPHQGDLLTLPSARLRILAPSRVQTGLPAKDANSLSVVAEFRSRDTRVFFTGDATTAVLESLSPLPFAGKTIVKIPHHGSAGAISANFLRLAHPALTVISVGRNNPFGHPSRKLTDLLQALSIPMKRTDADGDVVVTAR